jgi:hypothetical protein
MTALLTTYSDDKVNDDEMGQADGTYDEEDKYIKKFGWGGGGLTERDHLEDIRIDVRKILKPISKNGVTWINLAQNRLSGGLL